MSRVQALIRDWLPPIAVRTLRHMHSNSIRFEQNHTNWDEAAAKCTDYSAEHILAKVLDATLKVKRGEAAFERDSVLFNEIEYVWPVLAGLMRSAACNAGILNVLDFGGALGSSYFQNRKFLDVLPEVHWNIIEQSHYVEAGKIYIQDDNLRFYPTIEACLTENQPNVVLLSSVLQYLPDVDDCINQIKALCTELIIIDRTIVNDSDKDEVYIQRVPPSIYPADYPCRSLSKQRLISRLSNTYELEASFPSLYFPALEQIRSQFRGYIFRKISS